MEIDLQWKMSAMHIALRRSLITASMIFASVVTSAANEAVTPPAHGPAALMGEWRADCDTWGAAARCELDWAPGLHENHTTVRYAILHAGSGESIFSGDGVYRITGEDIIGYWSDSGGAIHPLSATWEDGALTTHWGTAGSAQGRTRYHLGDDGSLQVTDWALNDDGWVQFMDVTYQRQTE